MYFALLDRVQVYCLHVTADLFYSSTLVRGEVEIGVAGGTTVPSVATDDT